MYLRFPVRDLGWVGVGGCVVVGSYDGDEPMDHMKTMVNWGRGRYVRTRYSYSANRLSTRRRRRHNPLPFLADTRFFTPSARHCFSCLPLPRAMRLAHIHAAATCVPVRMDFLIGLGTMTV